LIYDQGFIFHWVHLKKLQLLLVFLLETILTGLLRYKNPKQIKGSYLTIQHAAKMLLEEGLDRKLLGFLFTVISIQILQKQKDILKELVKI